MVTIPPYHSYLLIFVASSEEDYDSEYYDEDEEAEMADQEDEEQSESQGMDFSMSM